MSKIFFLSLPQAFSTIEPAEAESEQLKVAIYVMIGKNRFPSFLQQNKSPSFMMLDYHKDDNNSIIATGKHHDLVILDSRLS